MSLMNYNILKNITLRINLLKISSSTIESIRHYKHYNPKYKKLRGLKFIKVDLPDFHENLDANKLTPEEIRAKMKEKGLQPVRPWHERPIYVSCTGATFEPYVPPEGDGKKSAITLPGAKQKYEFLEKKSKSFLAIRKIKKFEDFETSDFIDKAQDIYIKAHEYLALKDKNNLRDYVTEKALMDMMINVKNKTIKWKFLQSLEPPRVVHARCTDLITKENIYGQVTVRFHTQQMLTIYDRFGRLMFGNEILAKDILEYVVFEKHLSNQYGQWRIHDKIINEETKKGQEHPLGTYVQEMEEDILETTPTNIETRASE